jgi:excisionase family DNA binding protein
MDRISPFLSVHEAAKEFKIGRNRLYEAIKAKELRAYKPNSKTLLINPNDIIRWIFQNPL